MFMAMLDGLKEESVGFLFNVSVEAVPSPQVAQVQAPEGLAEFAAAAAAGGQSSDAPTAPREEPPSTLRAKGIDNEAPALTYSGPFEDGSAQVQRNGGGAQKTPAGYPPVPAVASDGQPRDSKAAGPSRRNRRKGASPI